MIEEDDFEDELEDYGETFNPPTTERIKVSIDKVLKTQTGIRKAKPTVEDKKREEFCGLITRIDHAAMRGTYASEFLPMDEWDDMWLEIIEDLLKTRYSPGQLTLINFYLYERYDEIGQVKGLEFADGNVVYLDTVDQLYALIKNVK